VSADPRSIRFYFDYISSNAYLAWTQLAPLAAKYGAVIKPVPVLFAGLLEAHGQLGPAEVPAKSRWMVINNARKAMLLGVPLQPPAHHPFNPLLALRVSSLPMSPAERSILTTALFEAVWVRGLHVSEPAVVERVATEAGFDGRDCVARAALPETKARLRQQTDDAIARGVFGVPSMEVGSELFWGYDDFTYLEVVLAGRDPLAQMAHRGPMPVVTPSAQRRRVQQPSGAPSTPRTVEFYFDYGSPWSYLASTQLAALGDRTGCTVVYRPMLLGGVFKATGNQSPAATPIAAKLRYGSTDLLRYARLYEVPFHPNPHFPINTLLLMRVATAAQQAGVFERFHAAIYPAFWAEGKDLGNPDVIAAVLAAAGLDAPSLLARAGEDAAKSALRATTDEAVRRGAFGAPTFFVGDEMFFGNDRLALVERALRAV